MGKELRASDLSAVRGQLGREPTTPFVVVARCSAGGGHPLVIRNEPRDEKGDPFPTTYWLTCPEAVKAVSRLESQGWIGRLNERAETDAAFAEALSASHREYAQDRGRLLLEALDWGGVGGTRAGVKCLHAHYAWHMAGGVDPIGGWVASRAEPVHAEEGRGRVAAIDQGTNSIRLLVMEPRPAELAPAELARDMVITRLGQGVDATGAIDQDAFRRTISVLERYCRRARALHVKRIRVAATAVLRDAENGAEFATAVLGIAGSELEVITGEQEAALSFLGATHGLDEMTARGPYLVLDIGGGSTEFVLGAGPGAAVPTQAVSTQMGSVRLTERFVRHDPPDQRELRAMELAVDDVLDGVADAVAVGDARTLIPVGGTATTMQAISLSLPGYDPEAIHRTWLMREDAERVLSDLARMTTPERTDLPVMAPGRGDVIVAGAVILVQVMRRFAFERALVSETDILDGLAFQMLGIR